MDSQSSLEFYQQMFGGSWITQGIWVAAELGIADLLADGPLKIEEVAEKTHSHCGALYRVLRALSSVGVFAEDECGRFSLTPHANLLRSDVLFSQKPFGVMMGSEFHGAWGELLYSVQTGGRGFEKRFDKPFFTYMTEHPTRHSIYDSAMGTFGKTEIEFVLDSYDFSQFHSLVDVGGGSGVLISAILERHPTLQGILFDLPAVAERARASLAGTCLSSRCQIDEGDFFSSVPEGADAYIMQHVIHDWEDSEAVTILGNCRKAMKSDGRVLLVETVIPSGNDPFFGKWLDLMMLLVGGRERTQKEYRHLLLKAGLKMSRVIQTASEVSIVEAIRAN